MDNSGPICRVADGAEAAVISFRRHAPPPEIGGFVEALWTFEAHSRGGMLTDYILPDIGCEIICPMEAGAFLRGSVRRLEEIPIRSPAFYMGAHLRPGVGSRLFKTKAKDLGGSRLALADLGCRMAMTSGKPGLAHFTRDLIDLFKGRNFAGSELGQRAVAMIAQRHGRISVAAVASALDCSPRHLHRAMVAQIGIGPKTATRIARMRRAVALLDEEGTALAGIAIAAGYADQAHMTREFAELGLPSPACLRQWRESDFVNTAMPVPH